MTVEKWEIEGLFGQLHKLKALPPRRGHKASYEACCPAHDDNSPSLRIDITQEGKILLHCFAGCDIEEICNACNLTINDLFPADNTPCRPIRPINEPTQDHWFLAVIKAQIKRGEPVSVEDQKRYLDAARREARYA
jgi:hypothetical protein